MKTRAAVVLEAPGNYEVVTVDLDEPQAGEVLVRLVAAGLCHSDDHIATGDLPVATYPMCGGHEGAGVVEAVGPNTEGVKVGDHVVFSFLPVCGRCHWCATGHQNLCDLGAHLLVGGRFDGSNTFRMSYEGRPVGQMSGTSTFSEYTTVDVRSVIVLDKDVPFEAACLVGCGVVTGWGAAVNSAETKPGDTVIVMGVGGIGIHAVQGAAQAGAGDVIAVDPVPFKRDMALKLGATQAFASMEEATDFARSKTNGQGAHAAIVTVGVTTGDHIASAFASICKTGIVVVTGIGPMNVGLPIVPAELTLYQKRIQGSLFGAANPTADIPRVIRMYQEGALKLDEVVTTRYSLDQIAEGYRDMHAGKNLRGVIIF
ncbi:NDMA-dependent alcohol dehydrogenase [Rhodococcus koreensis]|uniref:NDMA-dependent alcohol dehydrogenase n=1 Tax=Rhodococcus koreensis TaxID=99653 RepID=UPI00366D135B